jgi:alpha-glucosidase
MTLANDWWRGAVIYQIYPRSFCDANNDGVGDIPGIISKLDYIKSIGVDAIWLSPFFTSPMKDFGYDVSDYCDVDPLFGDLNDFKQLVSEAHDRGLKILIDQVYSHTSDQHAWFSESRQNKSNDKADWYVWADAKADGTPPNNWLSLFGGSAWQWDTRRQQYYLHNFLTSQPDLNFHSLAVQDAILDTARFWLELGVDGFRLDVVNMYFHNAALTDNEVADTSDKKFVGISETNPFSRQHHMQQMCRPDNLAFLKRLRSVMDEYPGSTTVGEIGAPHALDIMAAYTSDNDKLHMAYTFELLGEKCTTEYLRNTIDQLNEKLKNGWPCLAISNHDVIRSATRWSPTGDVIPQQAESMLAFLLTLRGSVCLYQGEELGLPEAAVPFEQLQDPFGIEFWPEYKGRDGCRTPMPWDKTINSGFNIGAETWLPIDPIHAATSAEQQRQDNDSTLSFVSEFLNWRSQQSAIVNGQFEWYSTAADLLAYIRSDESQQILVMINLSDQTCEVPEPEGFTHVFGAQQPDVVEAFSFKIYEKIMQ